MARPRYLRAARGLVVLGLAGALITGFREPDQLTPGTVVAGTPTVGITGAAAATGRQIAGEVVGLDPLQSPPVVLLNTMAGQVYVQLLDPSLLATLSLGQPVVFDGQYLAADLFTATEFFSYAPTDGELLLGEPLTSLNGVVLGAPLGVTSDSSIAYSTVSGTTSGTTATLTPTPTKTPKPGDCSSDLDLDIDPETAGTKSAGNKLNVDVDVSSKGDCEDERVYLQVLPNMPNTGIKVNKKLNDDNEAELSYTGKYNGTDYFRVWMDLDSNGEYDDDEPTELGSVTWKNGEKWKTPTPATGSNLIVVTATPSSTPVASATATRTPTATATRTPTATQGTLSATKKT
jgi:hypothetical protein